MFRQKLTVNANARQRPNETKFVDDNVVAVVVDKAARHVVNKLSQKQVTRVLMLYNS